MARLIDLNPDNNTWKIVHERHFKNSDGLNYELGHKLQNLDNEEGYEEINPVEMVQHDWMEV